ncbi:hypothetical protein DSO57_1010606 [Entomophthora muscae]|uniref:Uncharacterized protein n=1 Tax=Entomophthora muscae TaxID=34485 RepID=A0ACC2USS0_9FUNG|nr:hypothetical protein DSO57_1010606 [Entomophthora muscae]
MFGRFAYLGHLGHLAMITVPIGLIIAGLNVGALAHQLGSLFPAKWVHDIHTLNLTNPLLRVAVVPWLLFSLLSDSFSLSRFTRPLVPLFLCCFFKRNQEKTLRETSPTAVTPNPEIETNVGAFCQVCCVHLGNSSGVDMVYYLRSVGVYFPFYSSNQFMHLMENFTECAQDIFATSENVVRSLTCDSLKLSALNSFPPMTPSPAPLPSEIPVLLGPEEDLFGQELGPNCSPWLLDGMLLMSLD